MRTLWRGIKRIVFWSFERGTWPYDLMVVAINLFVFLSPRSWFHDQPQIGPPPQTAQVEFLREDPANHTKTYRVDAHLLAMPRLTQELERKTHEVLSKNVDELKGTTFQIVHVDSIRGEDGSVVSYEVSVKK